MACMFLARTMADGGSNTVLYVSLLLLLLHLALQVEAQSVLRRNEALGAKVILPTSSTLNNPEYLVDGDDLTYLEQTRVSTEKLWWEVDLGAEIDVRVVSVVSNTLQNVHMTDEKGNKHWCTVTLLEEETLNSYSCPQFPARYIHGRPFDDTVQLLKTHEVMVSTEQLQNATVVYVEPRQSSSLNTDFRPEIALGPDKAWWAETSPVTCSGWCSATRVESYPWWSLRLSTPVVVYSLSMSARRDAHALRLFNAEVSVQLEAKKYICADIIFIPPGESRTFTCGMNYGRYVTVKLNESPAQLSLCKVKLKCLSSIAIYQYTQSP
uniref:uncharacterized protein n=1 Tax=Myxine glutinosa TaxID=7769 RepID=UPI00358EC401